MNHLPTPPTTLATEEQFNALSKFNEGIMQQDPQLKQRILSENDINIQFLSRGCVIRVGCKSIPFSSTKSAMEELQNYFENPAEAIERWLNIFNTNT